MLIDSPQIAEDSFIQNATLPSYTSPPGQPTLGEMYFNSSSLIVQVFNGTEWVNVGGGGSLSVTDLIIGTGSRRSVGGAIGTIHFEEAANPNQTDKATIVIVRDSSDLIAPRLVFGKSSQSLSNSVSAVANNSDIGEIIFAGGDGSNMDNIGATISAKAKSNFTASENPSDILFSTTGAGETTPRERLRVTSTGALVLRTSSNEETGLMASDISVNPDLSAVGLLFNTQNNSITFVTSLPRMIINSAGDIGVGVFDPTAKLHISGGVNSNNVLKVEAAGNTAGNFASTAYETGSATWSVGTEAGNGRFFILNSLQARDQLAFSGGPNSSAIISALGSGNIVLSSNLSQNFEFTTGSSVFNGGILEYANRAASATRPDFDFVLGSSNGSFKFFTNTTEKVRITNDGALLVGTTVSGGELALFRKDQASTTTVKVSNNNTSISARSSFDLSTGTPDSFVTSNVTDNSGSPYYQLRAGSGVQTAFFDMPAFNFRSSSGTSFAQINSAGFMSIGSNTVTGQALRVAKNPTGTTNTAQVHAEGLIQPSVTNSAYGFTSILSTEAASFSIQNIYNYNASFGSRGAGSNITNIFGLIVSDTLSNASALNTYGVVSQISNGANKWNTFNSGTAPNYFAGRVGIGTMTPQTSLHVAGTDSVRIASGTTAQRPASPSVGDVRYNTTNNQYEGFSNGAWGVLGGATGGSGNAVFYENDQVVTSDYTITSGKNAMSAGPITINNGVTVTIPDNSTWTIV